MKNLVRLSLAVGTMLAVPFSAQAQFQTVSPTITFDDVLPGTVINTTYDTAYHVTFSGTSPNPNNNGIQAIDTVSLSKPNALDATTSDAVRVTFSPSYYPQGIDAFNIFLLADPQGFGSTNAALQFFDKNGAPIGSLTVNETANTPLTFTGAGVQSVLLPADAYYDNLNFRGQLSVPEPGAVSLAGAALIAITGLGLRRKSRRK